MTLKLGEIINIYQALQGIIDDEKSNIEALFKFKLLGMMKKLDVHIQNFEIIKNDKIKEYGVKMEDGNIGIPPENEELMEKFKKSLEPVLKSDIDVDIEKFKASEICSQGVRSNYLLGLYSIIEEQ